jgi:ABC-type antimicrobial peptide transport system permease subunit
MPIYGGKFPGSFVVYVRTSGDEKAVFGQVRGLIRQIDPALPIYGVKSMEEQVDQILSTERMVSFLAAAFGAIATILAAIGLYGVLSLAVSRRLKEIGIRLALGANTRNILQLILAEIVWLMAAGIVVGVPGAVLLSRYVESQLYGLKATDPITISVAVGFIISVALLAALAPSWRARGVNPVDVLRYE